MSKLKLFCNLPECCKEFLTVEVYDKCGILKYDGIIKPNKAETIYLPDCCSRLKVTNHSGLTPGSITKYYSFDSDSALYLIFGGRCSIIRRIRFRLTDANYPGITVLTGGLTVMAASNITIPFTNGAATVDNVPVGTYSYVSNTIPGYQGATMPDFTINSLQTNIELKLSANGTLTVNVVDDVGSPVQAGSVQMYALDGTTPLGAPVEIKDGAAVFNYVPHTSTGINFIIKQAATDGDHILNTEPVNVSMTQQTQAVQIINQRVTVQVSFKITDANYPGIIPASEMDGNVVVNG